MNISVTCHVPGGNIGTLIAPGAAGVPPVITSGDIGWRRIGLDEGTPPPPSSAVGSMSQGDPH